MIQKDKAMIALIIIEYRTLATTREFIDEVILLPELSNEFKLILKYLRKRIINTSLSNTRFYDKQQYYIPIFSMKEFDIMNSGSSLNTDASMFHISIQNEASINEKFKESFISCFMNSGNCVQTYLNRAKLYYESVEFLDCLDYDIIETLTDKGISGLQLYQVAFYHLKYRKLYDSVLT